MWRGGAHEVLHLEPAIRRCVCDDGTTRERRSGSNRGTEGSTALNEGHPLHGSVVCHTDTTRITRDLARAWPHKGGARSRTRTDGTDAHRCAHACAQMALTVPAGYPLISLASCATVRSLRLPPFAPRHSRGRNTTAGTAPGITCARARAQEGRRGGGLDARPTRNNTRNRFVINCLRS